MAVLIKSCILCGKKMYIEEKVCVVCRSPKSPNLFYRIRSGWDENPFWFCELRFTGPSADEHVHLGRDVFDGATCGLEFSVRGSWFPMEVRKGQIVFATSLDAAKIEDYQVITKEVAIVLLQ